MQLYNSEEKKKKANISAIQKTGFDTSGGTKVCQNNVTDLNL